jgi:flagellar basal body rod protein FlgG
MGVSGELVISGTTAQIDRNGEVREDDRVMGQIKLVRFSDPQDMVSLGNGAFYQGSARLADAGVDGNIRAGYLENSNVNSPQEMVRLTETLRHFEAMQKIMQGYDDAFEKALHKLGDF